MRKTPAAPAPPSAPCLRLRPDLLTLCLFPDSLEPKRGNLRSQLSPQIPDLPPTEIHLIRRLLLPLLVTSLQVSPPLPRPAPPRGPFSLDEHHTDNLVSGNLQVLRLKLQSDTAPSASRYLHPILSRPPPSGSAQAPSPHRVDHSLGHFPELLGARILQLRAVADGASEVYQGPEINCREEWAVTRRGPAWHMAAPGRWARGWRFGDGLQRPLAQPAPVGAQPCPALPVRALVTVAVAGLPRVKAEAPPISEGPQPTGK